ncbi:MAG: HNH endonuclease family protein [Spirochaetota bacterium]
MAKYILLCLENQRFNKDYSPFETDVSIEHIFLENYMGEEPLEEQMIYRLGNLTVLEVKLNNECGNKQFLEKKDSYKKSQYESTKEISDFDEWNAEQVRNRQNQLAKIATSMWRIHYYDNSLCSY